MPTSHASGGDTSRSHHTRSIYRSAVGRAAVMAWYERKLGSLPLQTEQETIPTRVGPTSIVCAGPVDGPPIVVLHGMNLNAAAMAPALVALARTFRVYVVDIIGMPGQSTEIRLPRTGSAYVHWLLDVLDGLQLPRASFVGLSFGGWLILKLAAVAPERIQSGVLLDSGGLTPFTLRGQLISGLAALRYRGFPTEANKQRATARLFYAPSSTPDPDLVDLFALGFRHVTFDVDPRGLPPLPASALRKLHAPMLVLYGADDLFFAAGKALTRAREVLPNLAAAELLPDQGHMLGMEAYEAVYGRIGAFLANQL